MLVVSALLIGAAATGPGRAQEPPPWAIRIREVDEALARGDLDAAVRRWHDADRLVRASPGWEALLEVGDAARRLDDLAGVREPFDAQARELYLAALARARREESLDGVLRTAEAFADLGDSGLLEESLRIAKVLAGGNPEGEADLRAFARRYPVHLPAGGESSAAAAPVGPR
jgi:hypothetical protein